MTMTSPDAVLLTAQQAGLSRDERIDTLSLDALKKGVPDLPIAASIVEARVTLTIEGASTLELAIHDPDWLIERSGVLDVREDGRMDAIDVTVDALTFRLAQASRQDPTTLRLTCEDIAVALLREHNKPKAWSRSSVTRAQAIEQMVREVKARRIPFYSPEKGRKQPTQQPEFPDARPAAGETGFDKGVRLKVGGDTLDAEQMRNAATVLTVADEQGAGPKATMALLEACIVEGPRFSNPEGGEGTSSGILQLTNGKLRGSTSTKGGRRDVALVARLFLTQGFTGQGGAIELARKHPDWSAGRVAQACQGSRFPDRYDKVHDDAQRVLSAWNSGGGAKSDQVLRVKQYQFTRGLPGKKETSWDAGTRLAGEVNWRLYAVGGIVAFVSDEFLLSKPAGLVLDGIDDHGLLEPPTYDWDHGKLAGNVTLRAAANRWSVAPGEVVALRDMGPVTGRWIVHTVEFDLLDATDTTVTLIKPLPPRKEPAAQVVTVTTGPDAVPTGAKRALAWARSKIGHYKEEFGSNRGEELDNLERGFGLLGAPWCAMFATTAVTHGGVPDDALTASVKQIRAWAQAGTHGYQKGFRATPQPGDLMCFGDEHVGIVEKVKGDTVTTIEGNTSAGTVERVGRLKTTGQFVRPDYAS